MTTILKWSDFSNRGGVFANVSKVYFLKTIEVKLNFYEGQFLGN